MPRRGIATLAVCGLLAAGCGSGSNGSAPRLTSVQAQALIAQLERARVTAAAHDVAGTRAALTGFRAEVARLRRAGAISSATAAALRTGAARVLARAASESAPPPAPAQTTPAPAPTTPAPAPGPKKKHDQKKHHGKGKGHGGGGD